MRMLRAPPTGAALFLVPAVLFLGGAVNATRHGLQQTMQVGLLGAAAAIGVVYVFCDWSTTRCR
jgi:hypothetical protein